MLGQMQVQKSRTMWKLIEMWKREIPIEIRCLAFLLKAQMMIAAAVGLGIVEFVVVVVVVVAAAVVVAVVVVGFEAAGS